MKRILSLSILLSILLSFNQTLEAGETGKIFGRVVDRNTREPLPGVNVIIEGTFLGGSTDLNGEFIVINIPPGTYTVQAMMIGYQTVSMTKVRIQSDQTAVLDFALGEETLELSEEIRVVADRPLVQRDLTSSKKVTSAEEIEALPVETFAGILSTQAGITQGADGALHIRGGRSNEIAYLVDGISVANPYSTNGLGTSVANIAIQEMTVVSGAFNAEYGNAMSGVVNLITKDGKSKFSGSFTAYSGDYVTNRNEVYVGLDDFNPVANKVMEGTFSGPLPQFLGDNSNFFISGRFTDNDGYLYGIREHLPSDSANFNKKEREIQIEIEDKTFVTITEFYDQWDIEINGDNAIVPMNPSKSMNLLGKLKFQITPYMNLRLQSIYNDRESKSYSHFYKYNPDGGYNYYVTSFQNSLKFVHTLSSTTFYEARLAHNYRNYEQYVYEDPFDERYVPTDKIQGSPGGSTFAFGGTYMGHVYQKSNSYIGKIDLTSQLGKRHLIKTGVEARLHRLDRENFTILYDRIDYHEPTVLGLDSPTHDKYERWPREISAYFQDKIEYESMVMNIGLRYDYFFSDATYAQDPLQPDGKIIDAEAKHLFSPRLGISFPITAGGFIHFSYGHFSQMPSFSSLYVNPDFELPLSSTPTFGNANLEAQQTIMYELGLQQQLTSEIALDVTAFYRDVRNLLTQQRIKFQSIEGDLRDYRVYMNQDYGNIKGVTLSMTKRMSASLPLSVKIDYTFQVAEGNNNNTDAFYYNSLSGQTTIKEIVPLDWDQSHNLYGTVTVIPVDNLTCSFIGKYSTGLPYSPFLYQKNYDTTPNTGRKPDLNTFDLMASYRFKLSNIYLTLFTRIYNLFDQANERYVWNDTGRASYTYAYRGQSEPSGFVKHYGEPGVHTYDEYVIRPDYYRAPREVRFGVTLDF